MFDIGFEIKLQIIRHADLEDAEILSNNYVQLLYGVSDDPTKQRYRYLRAEAIRRIEELTI